MVSYKFHHYLWSKNVDYELVGTQIFQCECRLLQFQQMLQPLRPHLVQSEPHTVVGSAATEAGPAERGEKYTLIVSVYT